MNQCEQGYSNFQVQRPMHDHHSSISKFPIRSMGRRVYLPTWIADLLGIHICKYTSSHGWYGWWFRNPAYTSWYGKHPHYFTGFYTSQGGFEPGFPWISEASMRFRNPWLNLRLDKPSTWRPKRFWKTREEQQWRGKPQRGWAPEHKGGKNWGTLRLPFGKIGEL